MLVYRTHRLFFILPLFVIIIIIIFETVDVLWDEKNFRGETFVALIRLTCALRIYVLLLKPTEQLVFKLQMENKVLLSRDLNGYR